MEPIMKARIKIDYKKLILDLLGTISAYILFPMLIWVLTFEQNFNIPIDTNTYWAVMALLLIRRLISIMNHPPMRKEIEEYLEVPKQ